MTRSPFYNPAQTNPGQNYTTEMNKVWSPSNTSLYQSGSLYQVDKVTFYDYSTLFFGHFIT